EYLLHRCPQGDAARGTLREPLPRRSPRAFRTAFRWRRPEARRDRQRALQGPRDRGKDGGARRALHGPLARRSDHEGRLRRHVEGMIDVKGPAAAPSGTASLDLDDLTLWGESFNAGTAHLSLHGGDPRLQIDELTLHHGEAALHVAGRFGPRWQLDLEAQSEN